MSDKGMRNNDLPWGDLPARVIACLCLLSTGLTALTAWPQTALAVNDATATIAAAFASERSPHLILQKGVQTVKLQRYSARSSVSISGDPDGSTVLRLTEGQGCNGALFEWMDREHVTLRDITIDLAGARADAKICAVLNFTSGFDITVTNVRIVNAGLGKWILIAVNGSSSGRLTSNYLSMQDTQTTQNEGLNISTSYGPVNDWVIEDNVFVNTGALLQGSRITFCRNEVRGWGYGAGVSTGQGKASDVLVCDNMIHDSGTAADTDGVFPNGIESWGKDVRIRGNKINSVASAGIYVGGQNTIVCGNSIYGAGKRRDGKGSPGIIVDHLSDSFNGNGALIAFNIVRDDASGATTYGYSDAPQNIGVGLIGNEFHGSIQPQRLRGASPVRSEQIEARFGPLTRSCK